MRCVTYAVYILMIFKIYYYMYDMSSYVHDVIICS
jgi:hypothetical protein